MQNNNIVTHGPDPNNPYPVEGYKRVAFLKNHIKNPNIIVGDYTYYDGFDSPDNFEKNVLYHYPVLKDKLIIGKFCAIAPGVRFIMNGANHLLNSFTTYPFWMFKNGWDAEKPDYANLSLKGDTVIGNDVWLGLEAMIMPGIKVGDGAIIGTKALVTKDVPPYSIVGGNPAKLIRKRYCDEVIELLLQIKWWDWDIQKITANIPILISEDIEKLNKII
jgi:virginiamycin A acetyltransferase